MNAIIEKHVGKEAFEAVIDNLNGNEEYKEVAANYIEDFLMQLDEQEMLEEATNPAELLEIPLRFIEGYKQSREYGFSKAWSEYYGLRKAFMRNDDYLLADCFEAVANECLDTAKNDLRLYCEVKRINMLYII